MTEMKRIHYCSFVGEIEFESLKPTLETLNYARNDETISEITITLTSLGGYFRSALALYDYISAFPKPINIIAAGCCHSVAVLVLQAASRRLSYEHTDFMLHSAYHYIPDRKTMEAVKRDVSEYERQERLVWEIAANRTALTADELRQMFISEKYFAPQEALELGLIDQILLRQ